MTTDQSAKKKTNSTQAQPKKKIGWLLILILLVVLLGGCSLCGYVALNFFPLLLSSSIVGNGTGGSVPGVAPTAQVQDVGAIANAFMQDLQEQNYQEAYTRLDQTLVVFMSQNDFVRQAQQADACAGQIQSYQLIAYSTNKQTASYRYSVTRKKVSRPFSFTLTLQQDQNSWFIFGYGSANTLVPPGHSGC